MSAWYVWSAGRAGGCFPSLGAAMSHVQVVTNDHRYKKEIQQLNPGAYRYVGPRGRRHGTSRLVAFIGTTDGLDLLGINTAAIIETERRVG